MRQARCMLNTRRFESPSHLLDAATNRLGEAFHLFGARATGLQACANLLIRDSTEILQQPLHVAHADAGREVRGVLPLVAPLYRPLVDALDEVGRLSREALTIPFVTGEVIAPLAHRAAPVGDQIAQLLAASVRILEDRVVRAAIGVAGVLVVPVRR